MWLQDIHDNGNGGGSSIPPQAAVGCNERWFLVHGGSKQRTVLNRCVGYDVVSRLWCTFDGVQRRESYSNSGAAQRNSSEELDVVTSSTSSPSRAGHFGFLCGSRFYIHGGRNAQGSVCSDVFSLHVGYGVWEPLGTIIGGCEPPRMFGHSVCSLGCDDQYVIIGIESNGSAPHETMERSKGKRGRNAEHESKIRTSHAMCVYQLSLGITKSWRRLLVGAQVQPSPPSRREFSTFADKANRSVVLMGGQSGSHHFSDVWQFDLDTNSWREIVMFNQMTQRPLTDSDPLRRLFMKGAVVVLNGEPRDIDGCETDGGCGSGETQWIAVGNREFFSFRLRQLGVPLTGKRRLILDIVGDGQLRELHRGRLPRILCATEVPRSQSPLTPLERVLSSIHDATDTANNVAAATTTTQPDENERRRSALLRVVLAAITVHGAVYRAVLDVDPMQRLRECCPQEKEPPMDDDTNPGSEEEAADDEEDLLKDLF